MIRTLTILLALVVLANGALAGDLSAKKVLFIDSYHAGYAWSDGITEGVQSVCGPAGVQLEILHMDTKRNSSPEFMKEAAAKAKAKIESWQPDIVIAADDNASKHLIVPFYKGSELPFVFCGVNWDASGYGFPAANVTGMVEVSLTQQLVDYLLPLAKGNRIGFLSPDIATGRKEAKNTKSVFGMELTEYYAKDYADWKTGYLNLQGEVDILLLASTGGLYDDQADDMTLFVESKTTIPTGATYDFMAPYVLLSFAKVAEEQGSWAAASALKILGGASPSSIPITPNSQGQLFVNGRIATVIGAEIPFELVEAADSLIQ
jgi:ABC-type uncharacterized transport system substrate-binding protein